MIFKRNISFKLEKAIKRSPIVLLNGARQTGKTTLMKEIAQKNNYHFVSFDDIRLLSAAQHDPMGFISELPKPVIIDEIQRVPDLFLAIKQDVDQNRHPGRYLLTGSANPLLLPQLADSLAGRIEILTLYPLSQGEINHHVDRFIDTLWDEKIITGLPFTPVSRPELYKKICIGGFPSVQHFSQEDRDAWFNNYITAILQKDILDLAHIEGLSLIPRLLNILASHSGSLVNLSEISRQSGIAMSTLNRYIVLLETLFIVFFQQPWSSNLIRRIIKSPKTYLVDSGLLAWLLMIQPENIMAHHYIGHIVENFVVTELKKQVTWNKTPINLYHFRTPTGIEVDIILERRDGAVIGIEVKNSNNITQKDIKGLVYLQEQTKEKWQRGIILYTGNQPIPLAKDIVALPMSCLWNF